MPLLKQVAGLFEHGVERSQIRSRTGLSRGVMARIQERILAFGAAIVSLARGDGHLEGVNDPDSLVGVLRLLVLRLWLESTYALSRAVYPCRWPTGPPVSCSTQFVRI